MSSAASSNDNVEKRAQLQQMVASYQSKFPDVPTMTSQELVEAKKAKKTVLLVDVRTKEEQDVSMIPGAVRWREDLDLGENDDDDAIIVTYCTVGYRSGREARRLQQLHPEWKGRIYNLDGILAYTHVVDAPALVTTTGKRSLTSASGTRSSSLEATATDRVHTYGPAWNYANPKYRAVWFESHNYLGKAIQTVFFSLWRFCQHYFCGWVGRKAVSRGRP